MFYHIKEYQPSKTLTFNQWASKNKYLVNKLFKVNTVKYKKYSHSNTNNNNNNNNTCTQFKKKKIIELLTDISSCQELI